MYGKGAGSLTTTSGIAILPNTGESTLLLTVAAGLMLSGLAVLLASLIVNRSSKNLA